MGAIVPGVLVRRYADGTAAVLNMTEREMPTLTLEKGEEGKFCFALPPCGTRLFAKDEKGRTPTKEIGDVATRGWTLSRDRDSLRRIWFPSNNVARLSVNAPLKGVHWLLCDYPKDGVKVSLDGKPIVANMPCTSAPYGYAAIYREAPPLEWNIPPELAGMELPLEVEVVTSVRPVFGRDDVPDASFYKPSFWQNLQTQENAARSGLRSAKWKLSTFATFVKSGNQTR